MDRVVGTCSHPTLLYILADRNAVFTWRQLSLTLTFRVIGLLFQSRPVVLLTRCRGWATSTSTLPSQRMPL